MLVVDEAYAPFATENAVPLLARHPRLVVVRTLSKAHALAGIRVADFSHVMAGPYASHLLRLLGAEVIKIEAPGKGDAMRHYGADRRYDGMAPAFIAVNAGKQSIALDLKSPQDLQIAKDIVARCDVLLENFRPGVMERLGLGPDVALTRNPKLVYGRMTGWGQDGPMRELPGADGQIQHYTGFGSVNGPEGSEQEIGRASCRERV